MVFAEILGALEVLGLVGLVYGDCQLPPQQDINWSRLSGKWYEQTVQDLHKEHCDIINNIDATRYGSNMWMTSTYPSGESVVSLTISINRGKDPYHVVYISYHPMEGSDSAPLQQALSVMVQGVPIIADSAQTMQAVYFTDSNYKYFVSLACSPEGQKLVWVFGRIPEPTEEDIMNTRKLLIEIGHGWEDVLLEFSTCLGLVEN